MRGEVTAGESAASAARQNAGGSRIPAACIAAAVIVHAYVVCTIALQPLDVNRQVGAGRSAIWALHNDTIHRVGPGADFFAVYHAGYAFEHGVSPYADDDTDEVTPYYYPFRYLPVIGFTLGRFLAQFQPRLAYWMWIGILEALLGLLILLFLRRSGNRRFRSVALGTLLLSSPYALELHMGQFTFATLSLLCIGILLQESAHERTAQLDRIGGALCYALAALLKVFPLVTLPALIRQRRYRPSLILGFAAILAGAAPYFVLHRGDFDLFYKRNWSLNSIGGIGSGNFGFVYLVYLILTDAHSATLAKEWVGLAADWRLLVLAVTAAVVFFSRDDRVGVGAGAMILAHFLSYADVWEHHMSGALVVGMLILWSITEDAPAAGWSTSSTVMAICLVLLALPTPYVFFDRARDPAIFEPGLQWSPFVRDTLVISKVAPTATLYASCMLVLGRAGFALPWAIAPRVAKAPTYATGGSSRPPRAE
jgi:glycosyl transferase family 87